MLATCTTNLTLIDLITQTIFGEQYKSYSSSFCYFLLSSVTSPSEAHNNFLSTLFSNTIGVCSYLNASNQVSHPYKTVLIFLDGKQEDKTVCNQW